MTSKRTTPSRSHKHSSREADQPQDAPARPQPGDADEPLDEAEKELSCDPARERDRQCTADDPDRK